MNGMKKSTAMNSSLKLKSVELTGLYERDEKVASCPGLTRASVELTGLYERDEKTIVPALTDSLLWLLN